MVEITKLLRRTQRFEHIQPFQRLQLVTQHGQSKHTVLDRACGLDNGIRVVKEWALGGIQCLMARLLIHKKITAGRLGKAIWRGLEAALGCGLLRWEAWGVGTTICNL